MKSDSRIYVAGHRGLVGSNLVRLLRDRGFSRVIYRSHDELDLRSQAAVEEFFRDEKPEFVFLSAGRVGGIRANMTYPAEFIYDNIQIQTNVIHNAYKSGVQKLCFLASSCIYPNLAEQPMKENYLLSGELEPTNEPFAVAKIAGIKMCQAYDRQYGTNFISLVASNLYGPNDDFNLDSSHVLSALVHRIVDAKRNGAESITLWGTGKPRREFLHVQDMADACLFLMEEYDESEIINVGSGEDISIFDLAKTISRHAGFSGSIGFDISKPDGMARKLLDVGKISKLGWSPRISLEDGIKDTIAWYEGTI